MLNNYKLWAIAQEIKTLTRGHAKWLGTTIKKQKQ
jgi:hypothetical protein